MVAGDDVHALGGFAGQLVDLGFDVFDGLFGGHGSMLAKWAKTPLELVFLEPALSNGARSFSRFAVSRFRFLRRQLIAPRGGGRARSRRHALGLGWPGGTPPWTRLPPVSL